LTAWPGPGRGNRMAEPTASNEISRSESGSRGGTCDLEQPVVSEITPISRRLRCLDRDAVVPVEARKLNVGRELGTCSVIEPQRGETIELMAARRFSRNQFQRRWS
jgi:hypothetical protein